MNRFFIKIARWIPAAFIIGVSWYLSGKETIEHMPNFFNADKIVHLICFAGLSFWISFGADAKKISALRIPVLLTSLYGIVDELHQSFTPGRECSFFDWTADFFGAWIGAFCFFAFVNGLKKIRGKIGLK
jgi:VanZ family protein